MGAVRLGTIEPCVPKSALPFVREVGFDRLPPASSRHQVHGVPDAEGSSKSGERRSEYVKDALEKIGKDFDSFRGIPGFGRGRALAWSAARSPRPYRRRRRGDPSVPRQSRLRLVRCERSAPAAGISSRGFRSPLLERHEGYLPQPVPERLLHQRTRLRLLPWVFRRFGSPLRRDERPEERSSSEGTEVTMLLRRRAT